MVSIDERKTRSPLAVIIPSNRNLATSYAKLERYSIVVDLLLIRFS